MSDIKQPQEGHVFVATYGSLRTGMQNDGVNVRAGATSLGNGKTKENYDLYRYAGCYFPSVSLVNSESNLPVVVEVFEAPSASLTGPYDMLEGYPSFYNRTQIPVILDSGEEVIAWIYHIDEAQDERVEDGDWVNYVKQVRESY